MKKLWVLCGSLLAIVGGAIVLYALSSEAGSKEAIVEFDGKRLNGGERLARTVDGNLMFSAELLRKLGFAVETDPKTGTVSLSDGNGVIGGSAATVGGNDIGKASLYDAMMDKIGGQTLQEMVIRALAHEQAKSKGLVPTDEELTAKAEEIRESFPSARHFEQFMSSQGLDEAGFREQIRMQLELGKLFADRLAVTEEEWRQFYEMNEASFHHEALVRASHILVKTKEKAEELLKELDKGTDFAELARQFSADVSTREAGGDLGYFGKNQVDPAVEKAAFQLDIGKHSGAVQSAYGFHIVLVTGKQAESTESPEDAKDRIVDMIRQQRLNEIVPQWLAEATSSGLVNVHIPNPQS